MLTTTVAEHGTHRTIQCALCITTWQEQWIGISLNLAEEHVGSLCPRCLSESPRVISSELSQLAELIKQELANVQSEPNMRLDSFRLKVSALKHEMAKQWLAIIQNFETAQILQKRAQQLKSELIAAHGRCRVLLEQAKGLRAREFPSIRSRSLISASPSDLIECLAEDAALVQVLASNCPNANCWNLSLHDVIERERAACKKFTLGFDAGDIQRLVDDRYRVFLGS